MSIQSSILRFLLKKTVNWNKPLNEVREFQQNIEKNEKIPQGITIEKFYTNGIESEWFIPQTSDKSKTLIYFHGGGYCLGIVNANRNFVLKLAATFNTPILLLNYRLAPENPFPAAINDAISAYKTLIENHNFKPENIGCIGDSSGCGLCLVTLQKLKEENYTLPKFLAFMSPMVDLTKSGKSHKTMVKKDPMIIKPEFFIDNNYIANNNPADPQFSPIFGNLSNLPETLIQASEYDIFFSDSEILYEKLNEYGVKAHMTVWKKMWHNFQLSEAILPEGKKAIKELQVFIQSRL
ncbi:MAG: alpha/beta hydrolase [Bacteroidales bacterium]|nr:MAG: alpha/beta hydrolase [Bacteroidales bacterium]